MKVIFNAKKSIIAIMGKQDYDKDVTYRQMAYVVSYNDDDGNLVLYNNITKSMVVLDPNEAQAYKKHDFSNDTIRSLLENWYFVKQDFEESKIWDQIYDVIFTINREKSNVGNIQNFVILTTTNCNARCFYCYEIGTKKINLDKQKSKDVADFIIRNCRKDKPVKLNWFGGEPLVGKRAIDDICEYLNQAGIEYVSSMISNGYLFDKALVKRAKDFWKLDHVQITLDGTRDVYNKIKAYVSCDLEDGYTPFDKVIDNIEYLCKAGVFVNIRVNLSPENEDDIENLIDYLSERYNELKKLKDDDGNQYVSVYVHTLFQEILKEGVERAQSDKSEEDCYKWERYLTNKILSVGLSKSWMVPRRVRVNSCMADSDQSVCILPDGKLTSCEHFNGSIKPWGSIYSKDYDEEIRQKWKEKHSVSEHCKTCSYYPNCFRLKNCFNNLVNYRKPKCDNHKKVLDFQVENTYKDWLKSLKQNNSR